MVIALNWGYNKESVFISFSQGHSYEREEFIKEFGKEIKCKKSEVFPMMDKIADFVNNELGEECLFEVS